MAKRESIKRLGWNNCDACGREFNTRTGYGHDWACPHCGHENQVGQEWANNAQRIAVERSREAAMNRKAKESPQPNQER